MRNSCVTHPMAGYLVYISFKLTIHKLEQRMETGMCRINDDDSVQWQQESNLLEAADQCATWTEMCLKSRYQRNLGSIQNTQAATNPDIEADIQNARSASIHRLGPTSDIDPRWKNPLSSITSMWTHTVLCMQHIILIDVQSSRYISQPHFHDSLQSKPATSHTCLSCSLRKHGRIVMQLSYVHTGAVILVIVPIDFLLQYLYLLLGFLTSL